MNLEDTIIKGCGVREAKSSPNASGKSGSCCVCNGKEDACVDVQHKKRGRPRLRDEREPRYEGMGPGYPTPPDPMRRPPSLYGSNEGSIGGPQVGLQRSQSNPYRILKSQPGLGPIAPRNLEYASMADANVYPSRGPQQPDPICAYLTMEMQIVKVAHGFLETIGVPSAATRKLHEIVSAADRDTIFRLQRAFEDERRKREPNYLPPIVPRFEGDHGPERVIESVMFGADELRQVQLDRNETLTFLSSDGQQRSFRTVFGLAKKGSTYFVVMLVHMPATPQMYQPSPSAYSSHSRETQYGYASQYGYQQISSPQTYIQTSSYADPRGDVAFRTPGALGQNIHPSANIPTGFTQSMPRTDYSQGQAPYQIPRSEMPQAHTQVQSQHQRDLQLPPIRDQRGEISTIDPARMKDERSRLGIDGLIEKPDSAGRGR
ncbi:hypothetical protein B0O99DRAFT_714630 [Bisporella sp. PMI_857]|nr:hypothetical protein B0O99DRAFT_714630 [Bisporella sp. PMI_857]